MFRTTLESIVAQQDVAEALRPSFGPGDALGDADQGDRGNDGDDADLVDCTWGHSLLPPQGVRGDRV